MFSSKEISFTEAGEDTKEKSKMKTEEERPRPRRNVIKPKKFEDYAS